VSGPGSTLGLAASWRCDSSNNQALSHRSRLGMPKEGQAVGGVGAGGERHGAGDAVEAASELVGVPRPADAGGKWPVGEDVGCSSSLPGQVLLGRDGSEDTAGLGRYPLSATGE